MYHKNINSYIVKQPEIIGIIKLYRCLSDIASFIVNNNITYVNAFIYLHCIEIIHSDIAIPVYNFPIHCSP